MSDDARLPILDRSASLPQIDNRWQAAFRPGATSSYFDGLAGVPFEADAPGFSTANAWWLMELSRLIYKAEGDEVAHPLPGTRRDLLRAVGLDELEFFNIPGAPCAIVTAPSFAVLVFRGTSDGPSAAFDAQLLPAPWSRGGKVHQGFLNAFNPGWKALLPVLQTITVPIFYTGHSLGGALAVLAASERKPRATYVYGCPRVGNAAFAATVPAPLYRIVNNHDIVPTLPPEELVFGYVHVGEVRYVSNDHRLLPVVTDVRRHDDTYTLSLQNAPEPIADHAPVNYLAWMRYFHAHPELVAAAGQGEQPSPSGPIVQGSLS
jgi:triacylglycerol lipase